MMKKYTKENRALMTKFFRTIAMGPGKRTTKAFLDALNAAREETAKNEFACGMGLALAEANRMHDNPVLVKDVASAAQLTITELKRAGLAPYDLKELRKCID